MVRFENVVSLAFVGVVCSGAEDPWEGKWIWIAGDTSPRNFHLCARKEFMVPEGCSRPSLRITADTRYLAYLNGTYVGQGPIRSWPFAYHYDTYDLTGKLKPGEKNVLAVLVKHLGISTFQVIAARGGLLAEVSWYEGSERQVVGTDETWEVAAHPAFSRRTPRISCQLGWVEHFDARHDPMGWLTGEAADEQLGETVVVGPAGCEPWTALIRRPIPHLTREPVYPVFIFRKRVVTPPAGAWALDLRPNLVPGDREANPQRLCGLVVTTVEVLEDTPVRFHHRKDWNGVNGVLRVNGADVSKVDDPWAAWLLGHSLDFTLKKGRNLLVWDVTDTYHEWSLNLGITAPHKLVPHAPFFAEGSFVTYGPFADREDKTFKAVWQAAKLEDLPADDRCAVVDPSHVYEAHVFHEVAWAQPAEEQPKIEGVDTLCSANGEPAVIAPPPPGCDVEIVLDFGRMTVGFIQFQVAAPAGTVLDFLGFEGLQEGKLQLTSEMSNVCRYTCREGYQEFTSTNRLGFRYLILTLRNVTEPVKIFSLRTLLNTYPVVERGDFRCNDDRLNAVWRMGRYTTRLCSEDTFVDCPTYEQAFWVGDARNEGAVNMIAFGEYALSRHCLVVAGDSLERSSVVESQVPSGWKRILTAWSLLWVLACEEYYQATGDEGFVQQIYPRLKTQAENFASRRTNNGLLFIEAWNLLEWGEVQTPEDGIVTHNNAWLVESFRRTARLARILGKDDEAARYLRWAAEVKEAINRHLWNEKKQAYADCIWADGSLSEEASPQTNIVVYLTDAARPPRKRILAERFGAGSRAFEKIGTPFMMFFAFEILADMGKFELILELIRDKWGRMLQEGATTCWETFPQPKSRYWTRSHCHAWSAAPTYFLSAYQLGVRPLGPGFRTALIAPQPAGLRWARGRVPTPHGPIAVCWRRQKEGFQLSAQVPEGVRAEIEIPPAYGPEAFPRLSFTEGEERAKFERQKTKWVISVAGGSIKLEVGK